MKIIFSILFIFCVYTCYSQNVGIGTTAPAEKLDVNGNINVQGQLKVNGNAGSSGQVLAKDGSNNLSWMNFNNYPNFSSFDCTNTALTTGGNNCSASWTVPAGVTTILVECWGGGGGGGSMTGGGGGGYIVARLNVTPGATLSLTIGAGGNYSFSGGTAITGGTTTASISGITLTANGGVGGAGDPPHSNNLANPVAGGTFSATGISANQYMGFNGSYSNGTVVEIKQVSSTDFAKFFYYGNGGDAGNLPGSGAKGGFEIYTSVSGSLYLVSAQQYAPLPGGGGGADYSFGWRGAGGRVVIRW